MNDEDIDRLEEIRAGVGRHVASHTFGGDRAAARRAIAAIPPGSGVSAWTHGRSDRTEWFLTVMGEDREAVERAAAHARSGGGRPVTLGEPTIDALRQRRWTSTLDELLADRAGGAPASRGWLRRYGDAGVLLGPDGRVRPARRPQG